MIEVFDLLYSSFICLFGKLDYSIRVFATLIYYSYIYSVTLGLVIFYCNFFLAQQTFEFSVLKSYIFGGNDLWFFQKFNLIIPYGPVQTSGSQLLCHPVQSVAFFHNLYAL